MFYGTLYAEYHLLKRWRPKLRGLSLGFWSACMESACWAPAIHTAELYKASCPELFVHHLNTEKVSEFRLFNYRCPVYSQLHNKNYSVTAHALRRKSPLLFRGRYQTLWGRKNAAWGKSPVSLSVPLCPHVILPVFASAGGSSWFESQQSPVCLNLIQNKIGFWARDWRPGPSALPETCFLNLANVHISFPLLK